ncbi:hypothetical protein [Bacteroides faecis]|uniref:hypothetical protein n=1 Tax=Bacteroides faecis TaxID=674529 RepID=UPI002164DF25|nr:hypothetical protein [Bacteroides faecis]MCS2936922.1 hypothetical protein [Bacteroides faecis]UVS47479.1 hypothetical protein NXW99_19500 [Bacteroides faecis]
MEPVRLEILLDDKTLKGMRSVEGNLGSMGKYTEAVIANLESQLKSLQKQFKQAMSTGVNTDAQMADIQALQGVIGQLKAELEELKKIGKGKLLKLDISPYITAEVQALSSAEQKMKVIIANMQQDLDALRQKSLEATVTGVVNEQDQTKIKTLEAGIRSLTAELDKYTASKNRSNETPVIQDDPAPRLNNVKMSMQQIARELPAMAMGPQMFFLAISNNIPMFTDALASARKEYEALTAAGKKATPVWKQVLSSLFSWQTAMATAITLTVVYGKEIGNFFSQLVKGRKTLTDLADAQVKVNESMDAADLSKKIITIRSLQDRWNDLGDNLKEKKEFIKDNADEFKKLDVAVNNVNDAENLLVDNTAAFIEAMTLRAEAAAAFKLASEEAEKALKAQIEIDKRKEKGPNLKDKAISFLLFDPQWVPGSLSQKKDQSRAETVWEAGIKNQEVIKKTAEEDAETYTSIYNKKLIEAAKKLKAAGIDEYEKPDTGKSARDYQDELADARVKAQQKLEAARIAVMKDGIEKRRKLAKQELEESLAGINKQERDTLKKMEEAEKKRGVKITPEEKKAVKTNAQQQRLVAYQQYAKELYAVDKEFQEKDLKSWIEYNKEYGTYQQKRAAIMKEYTLKSSQEGLNEDDKKLLAKQRDEALSALDFTELKNVINWDVVFGNLDRVTKQELQKVKKQIIAFRNSPEFKKSATPEQIKVIEEAIGKIDEEVINKGGLFGNLTESIRDYSEAVGELTEAQKAYDEAVKKYGIDSAEAETARTNKNKAEAKVRNTENNLETSKNKAISNLTAVADAMNQLGDADMSLASFGSAVGSLVDVLSESGSKIGGLIASILAIFDQIAEKGLVNFAGDIVKSLGNAAAKMWGGLANVLTLGKFNIGGADYSDYNEMVDKYNRLNEIWDELIDKKSEYIEMSYGSEAAKAGQEALDLAQKSLESYKRLGKERLNSGGSTGSSSIGVRIRKSMSQYEWDQWDEFARSIGWDPNDIGYRMNEIFSLTADQLERLKEMAPDFWAKLTADESVKEYLDAIIEGGERIEEIERNTKEQLTQVSFDSMRDAFYDTLLDMESDAEDFADDFSTYLQKAILMTNLADTYDKRLQEWYDKFAESNKEGGISEEEYKQRKEEWDKIVEDALAERDALKDFFGWTSSSSSTQEGRAGTITSMTEETAGRLEGIGNAMLDHVINIDNLISSTLEMMATAISRIADNSEYLKHLETIDEGIMDLRRGVKMKG